MLADAIRNLVSRPAATLLIHAEQDAWRLDLHRRAEGFVPRITAHCTLEKAVSPKDTGWITTLLKAKSGAAREIVILSTALHSLLIEVFPDQGGASLEELLALEAQSLTGIPASDAAIGWQPMPSRADGLDRFWVCQGDLALLQAFRAACGERRLTHVGHPAGLGLAGAGRLLESWNDLAILHTGEAGAFEIWTGEESEEEAFRDPLVEAHLHAEDLEILEVRPEQGDASDGRLRLRDPGTLQRWAEQMARQWRPIDRRAGLLPFIAIPRSPISSRKQAMLIAGTTALALLLLGGHWFLMESRKSALEKEVSDLREPVDRMAALQKEINAAKRELRELDKDPAKDEKGGPWAQRGRMAILLAGIAESADQELVVLELTPHADGHRLQGIALQPHASARFADRLQSQLASEGWQAVMTRRTALLLRDGGGPWEFEIEMQPSNPLLQTTAR